MEFFTVNDIGKVRKSNQDSLICCYNKNNDFLALVADGVGGNRGGDVASQKIISDFSSYFSENTGFKNEKEIKIFVSNIISRINKEIYDISKNNYEFRGMCSTLVGILITDVGNYWFNAGDSRVYLFNEKLIQLSDDHSFVNELIKSKLLTKEKAKSHNKKNHILKAIGVSDEIDFDFEKVNDKGSYFLLCSDGLHGYVEEEDIEKVLKTNQNITTKTKQLLNLALKSGGYDNISIILIKNDEVDSE